MEMQISQKNHYTRNVMQVTSTLNPEQENPQALHPNAALKQQNSENSESVEIIDEPWANQLTKAGDPLTRDIYLAVQYMEASFALAKMSDDFKGFMTALRQVDSELANKNFGVTLSEEGGLVISDPAGCLSSNEKAWLTQALNDWGDLGNNTHTYAEAMRVIKTYSVVDIVQDDSSALVNNFDYRPLLQSGDTYSSWKQLLPPPPKNETIDMHI